MKQLNVEIEKAVIMKKLSWKRMIIKKESKEGKGNVTKGNGRKK